MRLLVIIPLALLSGACLAPGERDPTRYPWQRPTPAFCVVSLEVPNPGGPIVARGQVPGFDQVPPFAANRVELPCKVSPQARPH